MLNALNHFHAESTALRTLQRGFTPNSLWHVLVIPENPHWTFPRNNMITGASRSTIENPSARCKKSPGSLQCCSKQWQCTGIRGKHAASYSKRQRSLTDVSMDLELTTCYPNLNKLLICIRDSGLTGINDSLEKAGKSLLKTFEDGFPRLQERFRSASSTFLGQWASKSKANF